jgi:hypothetical protein
MITLNALDILNPVSGNVISKEFIVPTAENISLALEMDGGDGAAAVKDDVFVTANAS